MEIKTIKEFQKKRIGEIVGDHFKLGWIFNKWYEKLFLVILCLLGVWKIFGFFI